MLPAPVASPDPAPRAAARGRRRRLGPAGDPEKKGRRSPGGNGDFMGFDVVFIVFYILYIYYYMVFLIVLMILMRFGCFF